MLIDQALDWLVVDEGFHVGGLETTNVWRRFSTKGMWIDAIGPCIGFHERQRHEQSCRRNHKILTGGTLDNQPPGKDHGCMRS
jgi:hypothetical protein